MRMRLGLVLVTTIAVVVVTGACSSTHRAATPDIETQYADRLVATVQEARSAGASPAQLAVLERAAAERRPVTLDEYRTAVQRTLSCLRDGGLRVAGPDERIDLGVTMLRYTYGPSERVPEARVLDVADPSIATHSFAIEFPVADPTGNPAVRGAPLRRVPGEDRGLPHRARGVDRPGRPRRGGARRVPGPQRAPRSGRLRDRGGFVDALRQSSATPAANHP